MIRQTNTLLKIVGKRIFETRWEENLISNSTLEKWRTPLTFPEILAKLRSWQKLFFFFFWVHKEILNGRISPKQSDYPINSIRTRGVGIKWSKDFDSQFSLATLWSKILIKEKPLGSTTISQRWDVKKWKEEKVSCYSTIFKASSSLAKVVEEVDG